MKQCGGWYDDAHPASKGHSCMPSRAQLRCIDARRMIVDVQPCFEGILAFMGADDEDLRKRAHELKDGLLFSWALTPSFIANC